jgi:hypothetical protein
MIAPPPAPPASGGSPQPTGPRTSSRVVSIVIAVIGGIIVLGTFASIALSTVALANRREDNTSVAVAGVDKLAVDVSGGSLTVSYGDVSQAQLRVDRGIGSNPWTLESNGGTLTVSSPDHFGDFGWWPFGGNGNATLVLPASLRSSTIDGTVEVNGGSVSLTDGQFGDLRASTDAGSLRLSGTAHTVTARANAGDSTLDLTGVSTLQTEVNAGRIVASLTGTPPVTTTVQVSAGALDLTVPAGGYDVTSNVSAGSFHNDLGSTPGAPNSVRVDVSAGVATLSAGN